MKQFIEVDIPDGFDMQKDQTVGGYIGQSVLSIKLTPISDEAVEKEKQDIERIRGMIISHKNNTNQ